MRESFAITSSERSKLSSSSIWPTLPRSGGTPSMLLERLVETTGKTLLVQHPDWVVVQMQQSVRQMLDRSVVRRATHEGDAAAQHWMLDTADATVANILYRHRQV